VALDAPCLVPSAFAVTDKIKLEHEKSFGLLVFRGWLNMLLPIANPS
jgi:hypothetical protein